MTSRNPHGSLRGIIGAMRLTSLASLLSIVFGVGTNKIIAVVAGPQGVALIGLYRTLVGIVTSVVQIGLTDRTIQKLSVARSDEERRDTIGAASALFSVQSVVVVLVAIFAAGPIAASMFGSANAAPHLWEVRFVLATTVGVLALQIVTAMLNGQGLLSESTRVAVLTSVATLATVYPFLLLGHIGLAFIIGATCFLGAGVGVYYVVRHNRLSLRQLLFIGRWHQAFRVLPLSVSLIAEPLVVTGSSLMIQSLLARNLGTEQLGLYNAASLLEGVSVMVLTASMRSYFVPTLARFEAHADKQKFLNRVMLILNLVVIVGIAALVYLAPLAMRILFSGRFVGAAHLTGILAVSIVSQVIGWCYGMFLLHRAEFATRLALESVWGVIRVAGTWYCIARGWPLASVAWVHVAAYSVMAVITTIAVVARHGRGMLSPLNLLVAVGGQAALIALVLWHG